MILTINGNTHTVSLKNQTLSGLLAELKLSPKGRVIELNTHIHTPETFDDIHLKESDVIEIIQFMGGG